MKRPRVDFEWRDVGHPHPYYYTFKTTTGASNATKETLEYNRLSLGCDVDLDTILPECDDLQFRKYEVPYEFMGMPDVLIIVQQVREQAREQAQSHICDSILEKGALHADIHFEIWEFLVVSYQKKIFLPTPFFLP